MKKLIITITAVLTLAVGSVFAGCGMVKDAADDVGEAMTEAYDDASEAVSEAVSEIENNNNGDVKDNDGIINN